MRYTTHAIIPIQEKPAYFFDRPIVDQVLNAMDPQLTRVLDVGCGVPWICFELERQYQFSSFTCLDKQQSEQEIMESYSFIHGPGINQFSSFSDLHYSMNHQYIKASLASYERISSFQMTYEVKTDYDIRREDLSALGSYDVIIIQDVLHLLPFPTVIPLLAQFCDLLNPGGILSLQLPHIEHELLTDPACSHHISGNSYEHIYIPETAHLCDEYRFLELVDVISRHGIEMVVKPELYENVSGEGAGWIGCVGQCKEIYH